MNCPSCGGQVEPKAGPGRKAVYCCEGCRRLAEYQIRNLVRRLDKNETELRALKVDGGFYEGDQRTRRMAALRRWIKDDTEKLRSLLGAAPIISPPRRGNQFRPCEKRPPVAVPGNVTRTFDPPYHRPSDERKPDEQ